MQAFRIWCRWIKVDPSCIRSLIPVKKIGRSVGGSFLNLLKVKVNPEESIAPRLIRCYSNGGLCSPTNVWPTDVNSRKKFSVIFCRAQSASTLDLWKVNPSREGNRREIQRSKELLVNEFRSSSKGEADWPSPVIPQSTTTCGRVQKPRRGVPTAAVQRVDPWIDCRSI